MEDPVIGAFQRPHSCCHFQAFMPKPLCFTACPLIPFDNALTQGHLPASRARAHLACVRGHVQEGPGPARAIAAVGAQPHRPQHGGPGASGAELGHLVGRPGCQQVGPRMQVWPSARVLLISPHHHVLLISQQQGGTHQPLFPAASGCMTLSSGGVYLRSVPRRGSSRSSATCPQRKMDGELCASCPLWPPTSTHPEHTVTLPQVSNPRGCAGEQRVQDRVFSAQQ